MPRSAVSEADAVFKPLTVVGRSLAAAANVPSSCITSLIEFVTVRRIETIWELSVAVAATGNAWPNTTDDAGLVTLTVGFMGRSSTKRMLGNPQHVDVVPCVVG